MLEEVAAMLDVELTTRIGIAASMGDIEATTLEGLATMLLVERTTDEEIGISLGDVETAMLEEEDALVTS